MKKSYSREQTLALRSTKVPALAVIEKAVGMKARAWRNRCHEVACAMLEKKLVVGVERYGHYYGPVARRHPQYDRPFQRHGWIETPRGLVIDPTRWAFELVAPYVYHGPGDDYDAGGQRARASRLGPYPPRSPDAEFISFDVDGAALLRLRELTGGQDADFSLDQIFWLANLPLERWGRHAAAIYAALAQAGHKAAIPIDLWRMAMDRPVASHLP
jgi:hypothetical protein